MENDIKNYYEEYCYPHPAGYIIDPKQKYKHGSATVGNGHHNKYILVAGCGSCEAVMVANTNPTSMVVGVDISKTQVAISKSIRRKYGIKNIVLHVDDICSIRYGMQFDIIDATGVLHHIENVDDALRNIYRLLKDDGCFVGMVYSTKRPKEIRSRVEAFRKMKFTTDDVFAWMKNIENSKIVLEWFNNYSQTRQEIADTWLNPFFMEYDEDSLRTKLKHIGFDNVYIEPNLSKTNLLFKAQK